MKINKFFLIAMIALTPLSLMAKGTMLDKKFSFVGDRDAKQVCKAIVNDDAKKLHHLLRARKSALLFGYRFSIHSRAVSGSYSCNDLALLPFSDQVEALTVSNYLRRGTVKMEELVTYAD